MKFYQKAIEEHEARVADMLRIQLILEEKALRPDLPAICLSEKKVVMLSDKVDIKKMQHKETGEIKHVIKIAGYCAGDGGKWYDQEDLVQYSDSTRILYLK